MQYSLKTTEEDETMLVAEDILNAASPYSYVVIALFWASHHMCFYYGVTFDAKTQKNLCEKFDFIYVGDIWPPGSFSGFGQLSSFGDYAKEWILLILQTSGLQGLIFRVWQGLKLGSFERLR